MKWKTALAAARTWAGEKTTIAGFGVLGSTATGYLAHSLTPGQTLMGVAGALCLMILRENLQTLIASVQTGADGGTAATASVGAAPIEAPAKTPTMIAAP